MFHLWLNIPVPDIPKTVRAVVDRRPEKSGIPFAGFLSRHGAKILVLVPLAYLIWMVAQYAVVVPFRDQWELVPLLEKTYHGELTFHDLWVQHNEHRIFFPKIIMLVLARLTGWNIHFELAVNIVLAIGIFWVLVHQVKITGRKTEMSGLFWAIPAISLVVFSVSQFENWLWGWQIQMFLNLLAVVGSIVLLVNGPFRWCRFAASAFLGIVATYSFANGTLIWPIGLVILFIVLAGKSERKSGIIGWILIGGLTLWTYFYNYHKPEEHPPLSLIFKMPLEYAAYVFKYLGGICAQGVSGDEAVDGVLALILGLIGTVALGWAGCSLVRKKIADFPTLLPFFAMSLYSIASALITGVGRLGFGSDQALASRYCTMATPLWVSLIVFLILLVNGGAKAGVADSPVRQSGRSTLPRRYQMVAQWLLKGAIIFLVLSSVFAIVGARNLSQQQAYGRDHLLDLAAHPHADIDYQGLIAIYPRPNVVVERYPILVKHRLSVFRNRETFLESP
jgi:hypothetical protein